MNLIFWEILAKKGNQVKSKTIKNNKTNNKIINNKMRVNRIINKMIIIIISSHERIRKNNNITMKLITIIELRENFQPLNYLFLQKKPITLI